MDAPNPRSERANDEPVERITMEPVGPGEIKISFIDRGHFPNGSVVT
jgi:hypothetical protein